MTRKFSHSSNTIKLFKHLDTLRLFQQGVTIPIMLHMMPTHKCQMSCTYCCFKNRKDKNLEMPFEMATEGLTQFRDVGTKAVELTGGGEPTLYSHINELFVVLEDLKYHIGITTNGVDSQLLEKKHWASCDYVRISMNTFDRGEEWMNLGPIKDSGAYISGCYIWHEYSTMETFRKVAAFCEKEKIVCRVAPDCIKSPSRIEASVKGLKEILKEGFLDNEYLFLSDFNIDTNRHNLKCFIHLIKPAFYTDGNIYPCPSAELAEENDSQIQPAIAVCRYDEVYDYYRFGPALKIKDIPCSYCKYEKQNIVLEEVLTPTEFNDFA
jgi:organic radical activating enzyme